MIPVAVILRHSGGTFGADGWIVDSVWMDVEKANEYFFKESKESTAKMAIQVGQLIE